MKVGDADVVWVPGTDNIRIERHGSGWGRSSKGFDYWMPAYSLGVMGEWPRSSINDLLGMFLLFNTITVRDGVSVEAAHKAFLMIDEYRQTISPDTPGAEEAC